MNDSIYKLGLLESISIPGWKVTRVPGGWIFKDFTTTGPGLFVPYHNEFRPMQTVVDRDLPF
jgi:hypothetical protein